MDQTEHVIEWKARVLHGCQLAEQISPYIKLHRGKGVAQHSHPIFVARTLPGKEYMPPGKQTVTDDRQGSTGRSPRSATGGQQRPVTRPFYSPHSGRSARKLLVEGCLRSLTQTATCELAAALPHGVTLSKKVDDAFRERLTLHDNQ